MPESLPPNTAVLTGPPWKPGTVQHCDGDDIRVRDEDGGSEIHPRTAVAILGSEQRPKPGDEVLVQNDQRWELAKVLDIHVTRVHVSYSEGEHWVPLEFVAIPLANPSDAAAPRKADAGSDPSASENFDSGPGVRRMYIGWRYGGLIVLGFAALGPALVLAAGASWLVGAAWAAMHVILAAYMHALNRPLPRFHPAGFGKPSDPGLLSFDNDDHVLEHPPVRAKWELWVFLVTGWMVVGFGLIPTVPVLVPAICVALIGVGTALLAYRYDRLSALEARRLLGAKLIRDGADSGAGCLLGTAAGVRDKPSMWRKVLLYVWRETRTVDRTITDSDGNSQSVQSTQTSTYAAGLRQQHEPKTLVLDTAVGPVEVPLHGVVWAAVRDLKFGAPTIVKAGRLDFRRIMKAHTKAVAGEQILAQDRVAVVGELRRDIQGVASVAGGKGGPILLFAAGDRDPRAALRGALLRRRAMIAAMVILGLGTVAAALLLA